LLVEDGAVRLTKLMQESPASHSKLLSGDAIVKVNGMELTNPTFAEVQMTLANAGTKVRLSVRHPGSAQTEEIELERESFRVDSATGELFFPLLTALEKRLAEDPKNAGLFELRAELAGQENDLARQEADYSAAIKLLADQPAQAKSARLLQLYSNRG